eukprot:TRINITY_DN780025_c0_g1_i1.p1 TRINITY_DN780025_c0_g1~~TRINITY_DN780025_c0_g1_i1.p1  ORF type:complete len:117 (-),score=28.18 TRINITY_DN780025_c0_g1_i1:172-522(-)
MGKKQSDKARHNAKNKKYGRGIRLKHRTADIDQIQAKFATKKIEKESLDKAVAFDEDKPSGGKFFCMYCDRYFINQKAMDVHLRQKTHKKMVKRVSEETYTQADADAAAGMSKPDY